jgi:hypothetical protein
MVRKSSKVIKMCYAIHRVVVFSSLTEPQWEKFHCAVGREPPDTTAIQTAKHYIAIGLNSIGKPLRNVSASSVWPLYTNKGILKHPDDPERRQAYMEALLEDDMSYVVDSGLYDNALVMESYDPFPTMAFDSHAQRVNLRVRGGRIGRVHVSQEPGGKARFFASPRLIIQAALSGLYQDIAEILRDLDNDCSRDQLKLVPTVVRVLAAKQRAFSIDLSSATDTFPRELQWYCLRALGVRSDAIALLEHCASTPWELDGVISSFSGKSTISWDVGQPLGLKPSFVIFSLTMHALLYGIAFENGYSGRGAYYQLGDDHIGFIPRVEYKFIELLNKLGVEVSQQKSVISNRVAEFAGCFIRHDGVFFNPGKWRSLKSDTFIAYAADPEFRPERVFPPAVSRLVHKLRSRPYPYGFQKPEISSLDEEQLDELARCFTRRIWHPSKNRINMRSVTESLCGYTFGRSILRAAEAAPTPGMAHAIQLAADSCALAMDRRNQEFIDEVLEPPPELFDRFVRRMKLERFDRQYASLVGVALVLEPDMVEFHPLLNKVSLLERVEPGYGLAKAVLDRYPFTAVSSNVSSFGGFMSLLRRVADYKDVIPNHLGITFW